jgi:amidophosphoribosyltransferase
LRYLSQVHIIKVKEKGILNVMSDTAIDFSIDSQLSEKCAVFGVWANSDEAARVAYYGLWALQHRGQESSGIVSSDSKKLYRHAAFGLVANVYRDTDMQHLKGHIAVGHNRYATSGGAGGYFNQPFLNPKNNFALAHNGNLPDCTKMISFLKKRKVSTKKLNDTRMMEKTIACLMQDGHTLEQAIKAAYPLFTGVFSCVAMDNNQLFAFRDECGIRPLAIGELADGGYVVASETCALDTVGAKYIRDVKPGELVVIDQNGLTSHQIVEGRQKLDIFEFVYFARPDSELLGKRVNSIRENFGREMAKEFPIRGDVVVPVPDSSVPAALGYAKQIGLPFEMGLIKNRYINRTFIQPTAEMRKRAVKMKLNPIKESLAGKRVVLVDDSIVRGTTMRQVVQMMRDAGLH